MKKSTRILLIIGLILLLGGCASRGSTGLSIGGYSYDDASRYTRGGATIRDGVKRLDISWIAGEVEIVYHRGSGVILSETASKRLSDDEELHWYLDGDTLRIKYAASGYRGGIVDPGKRLTVQLPEDVRLSDVTVNAVSARVYAEDLAAENVRIDSVSGRVVLHECSADDVTVGSVSGAVEVYALQLKKLTATSVSGSQTLQMSCVPESIRAEAVSGSVTICLPENAGFTANADSVSGSVKGSMPMTRSGDRYTAGNGECRISVETVSGGIRFDVLDR